METRETIKSRMVKTAARILEVPDSEMEVHGFDPVINLLLEACSVELEKVTQEIQASRERIINRLVELLTPDVLTGPQPARSVLHAIPAESAHQLQLSDQFYTKKRIGNQDEDIYFSPAAPLLLVNGFVKYLACGSGVYDVEGAPQREEVIRTSPGQSLPPTTLFIGMQLHEQVRELKGLRFFFDWKNDPRLPELLNLLPFASWKFGGEELNITSGLIEEGQYMHWPRGLFEEEYSNSHKVESLAVHFFSPHFIEIDSFKSSSSKSLKSERRFYPQSFEGVFPMEDLGELKLKLLWLEVKFPDVFPGDAVMRAECNLNCFPALNRQLHTKEFSLQEFLKIIPLQCKNHFFDIERVLDRHDRNYQEVPLTSIRQYSGGSFTLRKEGVNKFDNRDASEMLQHLLDLLRDESAAFAAYDLDYLSSKIEKLNQDISDLEQRVSEAGAGSGSQPYLLVKPREANDRIKVAFWSTNGEAANKIPMGASAEIFRASHIQRNTIRLMTTSHGGKDKLLPSEKIFEYKRALLTRNRVVTIEDIRRYCLARLDGKADKIIVEKGAQIEQIPGRGVARTINVWLFPSSKYKNEDWPTLCRELETILNNDSLGVLPIKVAILVAK